jgi:hypothetical protein
MERDNWDTSIQLHSFRKLVLCVSQLFSLLREQRTMYEPFLNVVQRRQSFSQQRVRVASMTQTNWKANQGYFPSTGQQLDVRLWDDHGQRRQSSWAEGHDPINLQRNRSSYFP